MQTTYESGRTVVSGYLHDGASTSAHPRDAVVVDDGDYIASVEPSRVGLFPATTISSPGAVRVRPMAADPDDTSRVGRYLVGVILSGSGQLWSKRTLDLAPGTLLLYPASDPFVLEFDGPHRYFLTELSATVLGGTARDLDRASASGELSEAPLGRMAADMLTAMPHVSDRGSWALRRRLGDTVVALLRSAIDELNGRSVEREPHDLVNDILAWIDDHLGDRDLAPGRIAIAHHVSVRYLHRLFESSNTTVSEAVRLRRIERIKEDLSSPAFAAWSVAAIGARWGVADPTQLNRQFKAVENMTPGEWRRFCRERQPGALT